MSTQPLEDDATLDEALAQPVALLFKHSTKCYVSHRVMRAVAEFAEAHPELPVYLVEVNEHRELSDRIARELGVEHKSPQAIVAKEGKVAWHDSHFAINVEMLQRGWRTWAISFDTDAQASADSGSGPGAV